MRLSIRQAKKLFLAVAISFGAANLLALSAARAADKSTFNEKAVEDFYRGKQIRIVIGSGPGGTYDIYSRLLSKHMGRFIPGHPSMLVQSRAGAGGLIAANTIYNSEPKDGTVIGSFGETFPLRQAMGAPGIHFDSAKYKWIGSAINTAIACVARTDSAVATFETLSAAKPSPSAPWRPAARSTTRRRSSTRRLTRR